MVQGRLGAQHRPAQGGGGRVAIEPPATRSTRWISSPPSGPPVPRDGSPTSRSTVPPSPRSSTTPGSPRAAATASRGGSRWSRIGSLRRQLAALMQPVWDEYLAAAATGQTPFNTVAFEPPEMIAAGQPNELLERIEQVPVVLAVAADLARIALMDGQLDRPPDHGRRLRLPVLLERAARGTWARARRRDDDVPLARRTGRGPVPRPAAALRLGGDDLPRSAGAPADALAQGRRSRRSPPSTASTATRSAPDVGGGSLRHRRVGTVVFPALLAGGAARAPRPWPRPNRRR